MKKIQLLIISLFVGLAACNKNPSTSVSEKTKKAIAKEVANLKDVQSQKIFLEKIYDLDQKVRHDLNDTENKYGYDSEEAKQGINFLIKTDNENLEKVEQFLKTYGIPKAITLGEKAAGTPWLVVHHSPQGNEVRERNFKYIYEAYKHGDIDDGALTFFMNRWYDSEFGHSIKWERPFKVHEEVDTLIQSLGVQEIADELDKKFEN